MNKCILIVGDPISQLSYSSDSSLALAQGALELGMTVHWATASDLELINGTVFAREVVEIKEIKKQSAPELSPLTDAHARPVSTYTKIFIRTDPPFDASYTDLCWFLLQLESGKVINAPQALLTNHEKLSPHFFAAAGVIPDHALIPSLVSKNIESLTSFVQELFSTSQTMLKTVMQDSVSSDFRYRVIAKPWRGHGGRNVMSFSSLQDFSAWIAPKANPDKPALVDDYLIVQPLVPEIFSAGDRRVFIVNGEVAFDFVRRPASGKIEANLAQGGRAELSEMTEEQRIYSKRIALELKQRGILLAGLDFIGNWLTEINVTSPTGIRTFEQLTGTSISRRIMKGLLEP